MPGCHINRVPGRRAACVLAVLIWQCRPCGFAEPGAALHERVCARLVAAARPRRPRLQSVGRAAGAGDVVEGLLLEEKLGAGSFGTTWKATVSERCEVPDLSPGQKVALKLVRLEEGWTTLDKFERESSVLKRLRHAAVPSYYGSVVRDRPNGQDFGLVCNIVNGNTLEEELRGGRWVATVDNIKLLAETLLEVCVHLASFAPPIVHRDIKPQNILLEAASTDDTRTSWRTYLVDFGSAVLGSGTRTAEGTFGYMAPESFGRVFTPKSDLYSVGATLLYAATGLEPGTLPQERLKVKLRPAFVGTVWERQERWFLKLLEGLLEPAPVSSAAEALSFLRQPVTEAALPLGQLTASNSIAKNQATLQSRTEVTLEPPRGSRISVDRRGEELRVLLPPARWQSRVSVGSFGIAWTTFTAVWTAGVIAAGASFMALFSLPFWTTGAALLKDTFGPLLRGAAELLIRGDRWTFCKVDGQVLEQGRTADLQCFVSTSGASGGKDVVLEEGLVSVKVQEGLPEVEAEWLQALIEKHIERYK
ncbi:pkaA [Symbiodinium sp. CCMP2456]|nr:pkaA [Symbiodinium sp. CCMP2456]